MKTLLYLIFLILLGVIVYQDYKFRAVSWVVFPALLVTLIVFHSIGNSGTGMVNSAMINLGFLLMLFGLITLYFSIKLKRLVNITQGMIGWGDILFFICLAFLFSPMNFLLFFSGSLLVIVAGTLIYRSVQRNYNEQIPLAGLQALILMLLGLANVVFPFFSYASDEWILTFIS